MPQALEDGKVEVWLEGEKLRGGYALVRIGSGADERWLLIKMRDEEAKEDEDVTASLHDSVLSGRSLEEIAGDESR